MWLCETRTYFVHPIPAECWNEVRSMKQGRTSSALSFFSSLTGYSLPLGFGPCQMQKYCSNTRQTTLVIFLRNYGGGDFALAEIAQLAQRNIYVYVADSSCEPRYLARGFKDKFLKRFLRQHFTPLCRSLPHPLPHLPLHLWDSSVLPGDSTGAVHKPGRGDSLEEDLSPL